jgi:hypothetical protein
VLQNIPTSPDTGYDRNLFVIIVDGDWKLEMNEGDDKLEQIHGCEHEDVGSMRVEPGRISAEFYGNLDGDNIA